MSHVEERPETHCNKTLEWTLPHAVPTPHHPSHPPLAWVVLQAHCISPSHFVSSWLFIRPSHTPKPGIYQTSSSPHRHPTPLLSTTSTPPRTAPPSTTTLRSVPCPNRTLHPLPIATQEHPRQPLHPITRPAHCTALFRLALCGGCWGGVTQNGRG